MEYTIKKLAHLSGVSTRTLRYYDEIDLLKPARVNSSGYRIYGLEEVDRLQQILFYRSLDMKLDDIKKALNQTDFNFQKALEEHYQDLMKKRAHIDQLLLTVEKTLTYHKGEGTMTDTEKFAGFKEQKLAENETQYGAEIREKYGEKVVETSNKNWLNLSESEFNQMTETEENLCESLIKVIESSDLESDEALIVYEKHKEWLSFSWEKYTKEAHAGLAEMYVADERFTAYYDDKCGKGATEILSAIIKQNTL